MVVRLDPPLKTRRSESLHVLLICRISTVHQDPLSLGDQEALLRRYLDNHYEGQVGIVDVIASQGSGESLDRPELAKAETLIESRTIDLVLAEDLGRICRRNYAFTSSELAQDHDTRLIALNDHVDTGREDWQMHAMFTSFKHEASNRDTAHRIRRTLRNRFTQGGIVQTTIYGYIKPPGTKTDAQLRKDPAAEPIYDEMFQRLEDGASYSAISDWLTGLEIPTGPSCRSGRWTSAMVPRIVRNPILKGVRQRNRKMSRRVNKTGRRRSVDAPPEELLERSCAHLAFIEPARFDRVNALLARRNARFKRGKDGHDPRKDVPRKRTRWPGQHLHCGICGRLYRYGGHGQTDHLMCGGAYDYTCWNGVTADGPLAARKLAEAVLQAVRALPDFDPAFQTMVAEEVERLRGVQGGRRDLLESRQTAIDRQLANVRAALREAGPSPSLIEDLRQLETQREQILGELADLDRVPKQMISIPPPAELKQRALDAAGGRFSRIWPADAATDSPNRGVPPSSRRRRSHRAPRAVRPGSGGPGPRGPQPGGAERGPVPRPDGRPVRTATARGVSRSDPRPEGPGADRA